MCLCVCAMFLPLRKNLPIIFRSKTFTPRLGKHCPPHRLLRVVLKRQGLQHTPEAMSLPKQSFSASKRKRCGAFSSFFYVFFCPSECLTPSPVHLKHPPETMVDVLDVYIFGAIEWGYLKLGGRDCAICNPASRECFAHSLPRASDNTVGNSLVFL